MELMTAPKIVEYYTCDVCDWNCPRENYYHVMHQHLIDNPEHAIVVKLRVE